MLRSKSNSLYTSSPTYKRQQSFSDTSLQVASPTIKRRLTSMSSFQDDDNRQNSQHNNNQITELQIKKIRNQQILKGEYKNSQLKINKLMQQQILQDLEFKKQMDLNKKLKKLYIHSYVKISEKNKESKKQPQTLEQFYQERNFDQQMIDLIRGGTNQYQGQVLFQDTFRYNSIIHRMKINKYSQKVTNNKFQNNKNESQQLENYKCFINSQIALHTNLQDQFLNELHSKKSFYSQYKVDKNSSQESSTPRYSLDGNVEDVQSLYSINSPNIRKNLVIKPQYSNQYRATMIIDDCDSNLKKKIDFEKLKDEYFNDTKQIQNRIDDVVQMIENNEQYMRKKSIVYSRLSLGCLQSQAIQK